MVPPRQSPELSLQEQQDLILALVVLFLAIALVIIFFVVLKVRGRLPGCCTPIYTWQDMYEEDDDRWEGSVASERSYATFSRITYKTEPKPAYSIRSESHGVPRSPVLDAEATLQRNRLGRSMQLAAKMIQAMHLQAVPWGSSFSRSTLFRATLWQDVERRTYFFQVFDLIAYDPDLSLKLGSEGFLSDNPEPLLLVADTLWDKTQNLEEAKKFISELKLREYSSHPPNYVRQAMPEGKAECTILKGFEAGLKLELMKLENMPS